MEHTAVLFTYYAMIQEREYFAMEKERIAVLFYSESMRLESWEHVILNTPKSTCVPTRETTFKSHRMAAISMNVNLGIIFSLMLRNWNT